MKRVKNEFVEQNALSRNTQFSQKMIRFLSNLIAKVSKCQDLIFQQICPKKWFANFEQQSEGSDLIINFVLIVKLKLTEGHFTFSLSRV